VVRVVCERVSGGRAESGAWLWLSPHRPMEVKVVSVDGLWPTEIAYLTSVFSQADGRNQVSCSESCLI
jgi:hypothetical protein